MNLKKSSMGVTRSSNPSNGVDEKNKEEIGTKMDGELYKEI